MGMMDAGSSGDLQPSGTLVARNYGDVQLPPGPHTIALEFDCRLAAVALSGKSVQFKRRWESPIEVVDSAEQVVQLQHDPALTARLSACLNVRLLVNRSDPEKYALCTVYFAKPPVAVAFDVIAKDRRSGRECSLGTVWCAPMIEDAMGNGRGLKPEEAWLADLENVDVILRPSVAVAEATPDFMQVWGDEVVMEDVAVESRPRRR